MCRAKDAETWDRTGDLQIFSLTLSQLSYRGYEYCAETPVLAKAWVKTEQANVMESKAGPRATGNANPQTEMPRGAYGPTRRNVPSWRAAD